MPFHKSCYTSRSSGYKYRTLSTSTGPDVKKSKRSSVGSNSVQHVSIIDQKFINLRNDISCLISKELEDTDQSRQFIHEKLEKIEAKVNSIVELRDNVLTMHETLNAAEKSLGDLHQRVQRIVVMNEINSVKNRRSPQLQRALYKKGPEQEIHSSVMILAPQPILA